jgi:hypothetical protein
VEGEGTSKADAGRLSDFTAMGLRLMLLVLNLLTICSLVASSRGVCTRLLQRLGWHHVIHTIDSVLGNWWVDAWKRIGKPHKRSLDSLVLLIIR